MAKKQRIARVRYQEEKTVEKDGFKCAEGFALEVYDEVYEDWSLVQFATLTRSVNYPDEDEKEFIHWEFVAKMCELIRNGYYISRV